MNERKKIVFFDDLIPNLTTEAVHEKPGKYGWRGIVTIPGQTFSTEDWHSLRKVESYLHYVLTFKALPAYGFTRNEVVYIIYAESRRNRAIYIKEALERIAKGSN